MCEREYGSQRAKGVDCYRDRIVAPKPPSLELLCDRELGLVLQPAAPKVSKSPTPLLEVSHGVTPVRQPHDQLSGAPSRTDYQQVPPVKHPSTFLATGRATAGTWPARSRSQPGVGYELLPGPVSALGVIAALCICFSCTFWSSLYFFLANPSLLPSRYS